MFFLHYFIGFEEEPTMVMPKQEKRVEQESDTSSSESDTDLLPKRNFFIPRIFTEFSSSENCSR